MTTLSVQLEAYRKALEASWAMLEHYGWYPFGYHADQSPVPALEFSNLKDEDGDPWFERVIDMNESLQRGLEQAARGESRELSWILEPTETFGECPACGGLLTNGPGGGVTCTAATCDYWFCY